MFVDAAAVKFGEKVGAHIRAKTVSSFDQTGRLGSWLKLLRECGREKIN